MPCTLACVALYVQHWCACTAQSMYAGVHGVTQRELQRPGTATEGRRTTRERIATSNPNDRQLAPLTDQALGSTAKSTQESSRVTLPSAATPHACQVHLASSTQTQQRQCQSRVSKRNPVRGAGGPRREVLERHPPATGHMAPPCRGPPS